MSSPKAATPKEAMVIGAGAAAVGLYFMLVAAAVFPVPGGPRNLHAPSWVVLCAGLAFFLGGAAVVLQGLGKINAKGELAADAPLWMRAAQQLVGIAIFACFALIATWIALAGDARQFSGSVKGMSVEVGTGVGVARVAFAIGAIICWLATFAVARSALRKLFAARQG
jgi:hypothetical protein